MSLHPEAEAEYLEALVYLEDQREHWRTNSFRYLTFQVNGS